MAAYAVLQLQMNPGRARELACRSLELNPNSVVALATAGRIEMHSGNAGKALELLYHAERLSPREPRGWMTTMGIGIACVQLGRFDEAIADWCQHRPTEGPP